MNGQLKFSSLKLCLYFSQRIRLSSVSSWGLPRWCLEVKNMLANAGDAGDRGSIPGSGRSPGKGNGNPLQYSCLENPMDRGTWAAVHGVAKSQTRLKQLSAHTSDTALRASVSWSGQSATKDCVLVNVPLLLVQVHVPNVEWGQTNRNVRVWSRETFIAGVSKENDSSSTGGKTKAKQTWVLWRFSGKPL